MKIKRKKKERKFPLFQKLVSNSNFERVMSVWREMCANIWGVKGRSQ